MRVQATICELEYLGPRELDCEDHALVCILPDLVCRYLDALLDQCTCGDEPPALHSLDVVDECQPDCSYIFPIPEKFSKDFFDTVREIVDEDLLLVWFTDVLAASEQGLG